MTDIKDELLEVKPVLFAGTRQMTRRPPDKTWWPDACVHVIQDGQRRPLSIRRSQQVFNHSEDFEWGYEGSSPAQLALALLLEVTDPVTALRHYQCFKREVVASLKKPNWQLHAYEISAWLDARV